MIQFVCRVKGDQTIVFVCTYSGYKTMAFILQHSESVIEFRVLDNGFPLEQEHISYSKWVTSFDFTKDR